MEIEKPMAVKEIAELMSVADSTVRAWIKRGLLECIYMNSRCIRILPKHWRRFVESGECLARTRHLAWSRRERAENKFRSEETAAPPTPTSRLTGQALMDALQAKLLQES